MADIHNVVIKKDGFYVVKSGEPELELEPIENPLAHLREKCIIDNDVTLRDIMLSVSRDKTLSMLIGDYTWCNIAEWTAELEKESKGDENISYLEIYWVGEFWDMKDWKELEFYCGFHGINVNEDDCHYSVSGNIVNVLNHCVKLNENITVTHVTEKYLDRPDLIKAEKSFSFLEVLDAIYFDISFYGGPEESEEFFENLNDTVKEYEEENKKGEVGYTSFEEFMEELNKDNEDEEDEKE